MPVCPILGLLTHLQAKSLWRCWVIRGSPRGVGWTEHIEIYRRRFILRTEATWSWRLGHSTVCHPKAQQLGVQSKPEGRRHKTECYGQEEREKRKSTFLHHLFHVVLGRLGDVHSYCSSLSEISSLINPKTSSTARSPVTLICKIMGCTPAVKLWLQFLSVEAALDSILKLRLIKTSAEPKEVSSCRGAAGSLPSSGMSCG